jgi:hypothetical protein
MRRSALIIVALAGVAGLALFVRRPAPNPDKTAVLSSSGVQRATPSPASGGSKPSFSGPLPVVRPQAPPAETGQEPAPPPGETTANRALAVGEDGHLVVGPNVRKFFADSLGDSSDASLAASRARLITQMRAGLPPAAAAEAEALLDRYLTYRARARQELEAARPPTLVDRQKKLQALQIDTLGAKDAGALFGGQPATGAAAAQPNPNAPQTEAPHQPGLEAGGTNTTKLAAVDSPNFRQRLDEYRADLKVIDGSSSLNADQRTQAIERLRSERFTAAEQPLVNALEWKGDGEPDKLPEGDPYEGLTLDEMLKAAKE